MCVVCVCVCCVCVCVCVCVFVCVCVHNGWSGPPVMRAPGYISDPSSPDKPDAVNASSITGSLVTLNLIRISWSAPSGNNAPVTSYTVTYCVADPNSLQTPYQCASNAAVNLTMTVPTADIYPLTANRLYKVTLVAVNSVGSSNATEYFMNTTTSGEWRGEEVWGSGWSDGEGEKIVGMMGREIEDIV